MECFFSSDSDKWALKLFNLYFFFNISFNLLLNKKYGFPFLSFKIEISVKQRLCLKPVPNDLTNASFAENLFDKYSILFLLFLKMSNSF